MLAQTPSQPRTKPNKLRPRGRGSHLVVQISCVGRAPNRTVQRSQPPTDVAMPAETFWRTVAIPEASRWSAQPSCRSDSGSADSLVFLPAQTAHDDSLKISNVCLLRARQHRSRGRLSPALGKQTGCSTYPNFKNTFGLWARTQGLSQLQSLAKSQPIPARAETHGPK